MIDIRKRVKDLCREQGITPTTLAERIGMPQSTLTSILRNGDPKISVVVDMANAFGLTLSEFMQDIPNQEAAFTFNLPDGKKVGLFPLVMG